MTIKIKAIKQYFLVALVVMPHKAVEFFDVVVEVTRTLENKTLRNVLHCMGFQAIVCYSSAVLKSYIHVINGKNITVHMYLRIIVIAHSKYVILLSLGVYMKLSELM